MPLTLFLISGFSQYDLINLSINSPSISAGMMLTVQPPQPAPVSLLPRAPCLRASSVSSSSSGQEQSQRSRQEYWLWFMSSPKMGTFSLLLLSDRHTSMNSRTRLASLQTWQAASQILNSLLASSTSAALWMSATTLSSSTPSSSCSSYLVQPFRGRCFSTIGNISSRLNFRCYWSYCKIVHFPQISFEIPSFFASTCKAILHQQTLLLQQQRAVYTFDDSTSEFITMILNPQRGTYTFQTRMGLN